MAQPISSQPTKTLAQRWRFYFLFWAVLTGASAARAQSQCPVNPELEGLKVRQIKVELLFGKVSSQVENKLATHRGEAFTIAKGNEYKDEVKELLTDDWQDKIMQALQPNLAQSLKVSLHTWCAKKVSESECRAAFASETTPVTQCVDVIVGSKVAQLDIIKAGNAKFPLLHTRGFSLLPALPAQLTSFMPSLALERDQQAGTGLGLGLARNLLGIGSKQSEATLGEGAAQLFVTAQGIKFINNPFYQGNMGLEWTLPKKAGQPVQLSLNATFAATHLPQGQGRTLKNTATVGLALQMRPTMKLFNRVAIGGNYRHTSNRFFTGNALPNELQTEKGFSFNTITNGWLADGFARSAVWFDAGFPEKNQPSYQRFAAMFGYEKDIPLTHADQCRLVEVKRDNQTSKICQFPAKNAPTLGLEFTAGGGKIWGNAPAYASFYGGNNGLDFLSRALTSQRLNQFPAGPQLRSFGQQQAGLRGTNSALVGGQSYWQTSVNVSIPIPALSYPLIPSVVAEPANPQQAVQSCTQCKSLKQLVKAQAASQQNFATIALAIKMLSPQLQAALDDPDDPNHETAQTAFEKAKPQARLQAEKIWQEITPPIEYITDRANLFALKPLVMFDAARINGLHGMTGRTFISLGGGIQLSVVTAKFELGYMRTLNPQSFDQRGNFVMRIAFQNIF